MDIPALETMSVPLTYAIDASTPPSGRYVAENVLIDKPTDQNSRWSTSTSNTNQWITLRLQSLAIVKSITFGKYHKSHPCNMKDFKIYVGMTRDQMVEVLHASLKNDTIPEAFSLKHEDNSGLLFPTRFIKIVPLSAHGTSFNSSIWHISITGISDEAVVDRVRKGYDEYRESQALRYLLKHLRQRRLLSPYHAILSRVGSSIRAEHPLVSELHSYIVLHGDWPKAEEILHRMSSANLFSSYLERQRPHGTSQMG
uniref:Muskelin N-terminal domain-containing protein n=1 Tax=Moniliophthora roreri TaxID=221103 RepID=A0A0W0F3Q7_MONRR